MGYHTHRPPDQAAEFLALILMASTRYHKSACHPPHHKTGRSISGRAPGRVKARGGGRRVEEKMGAVHPQCTCCSSPFKRLNTGITVSGRRHQSWKEEVIWRKFFIYMLFSYEALKKLLMYGYQVLLKFGNLQLAR